MSENFKFREGEKVLCSHASLLYDAICLEAKTKENIKQYFIHYAGWKKSWDEWVPETRVLEYNEANVLKQLELKKVHEENNQMAKKKKLMRKKPGKVGKASTKSSLSTSVIDLTSEEPKVGRIKEQILDKAMFDEIYGQREFLRNIDKEYIDEMFIKHQRAIFDIFRGTVSSLRNDQYKLGVQDRKNLLFQPETRQIHHQIAFYVMEKMVNTFTPNDVFSHQDYLWKVSLPEFFIRVFMDKFSFDYDATVQRYQDIFDFTVNGEPSFDSDAMKLKI